MQHIGSKIFDVDGKTITNACICTNPDCAKITACFQSIGDARGGKFICPTLGGTRDAKVKMFKLKRACHHLHLGETNYEQYGTVDNRKKKSKNNTPAKGTRKKKKDKSKKEEKEVERKVIAAHHFHPAVVQLLVVNRQINYSDRLSVQWIKDVGLFMNGYTDADIFKKKHGNKGEDCFVPVPSYSSEHAWSDYQMAATRHQINDLIKSCTASQYGYSHLAKRGEDNIPQPVNKMAKPSPADPEDLQRAVCILADNVHELKLRNEQLQDELNRDDSKNRHKIIEQSSKEKGHGLTRMGISSDIFHKNNPGVARVHFRFEDTEVGSKLSSWDITKSFLNGMFGVVHQEPTYDMIKDEGGRTKKLTKFETCLVALMFFQNAYEHEFIGEIFGVHRNIVSRCIKFWAPHFREVGQQMARHTLSKEFRDKCYPQSYIDLNFTPPVATVVDGTDVLIDSVRTDRVIYTLSNSNKVKASAVRGVTWSLPMGLIEEFTDPFFARGSEKAIVKLWAAHGRFRDLPPEYLISGDKGFDGTSGFYPNYNPVIHPAFLTGGNGFQFNEEQIDWNRKACEMRYTSEVVFSRFKRYAGLGGIVRRQHFPYLSDTWDGKLL